MGTGEKTDALEVFHPDRLAGRILGMGDVMTLVERAQEHVDADQAAKMEEKLRKASSRSRTSSSRSSRSRRWARWASSWG